MTNVIILVLFYEKIWNYYHIYLGKVRCELYTRYDCKIERFFLCKQHICIFVIFASQGYKRWHEIRPAFLQRSYPGLPDGGFVEISLKYRNKDFLKLFSDIVSIIKEIPNSGAPYIQIFGSGAKLIITQTPINFFNSLVVIIKGFAGLLWALNLCISSTICWSN